MTWCNLQNIIKLLPTVACAIFNMLWLPCEDLANERAAWWAIKKLWRSPSRSQRSPNHHHQGIIKHPVVCQICYRHAQVSWRNATHWSSTTRTTLANHRGRGQRLMTCWGVLSSSVCILSTPSSTKGCLWERYVPLYVLLLWWQRMLWDMACLKVRQS